MKVSYVTMQFPVPSETFASNEVRKLTESGAEFAVHALRTVRPETPQLLEQRRLTNVKVTHNSVSATLRGLAYAVARPGRMFETLGWIFGHSGTRPRHLARSLMLLPRAFDVLREIERRRPDVVHVYWSHYPSMVGYLVQRYLPEIVSSISLAAYDLEMQYGGTVSVVRRADVVRTLSRTNVTQVVGFTGVAPERVEVIYNGVDMQKVRALTAGATKQPRSIATVGRLTRSKGMYEVLDAFAVIVKRWPDATLKVMGDGPEAGGLKRHAEKLGVDGAVEFMGHVDQSRVIEELARTQFLLLLTKANSERLPNVVKEGMACRCICITTPTPGIEELVQDGSYGFVVPRGDATSAARVLESALAGEFDLDEMIEGAYQHIAANFDLHRTSVRYLDLWRRASDHKVSTKADRAGRPAAWQKPGQEQLEHR